MHDRLGKMVIRYVDYLASILQRIIALQILWGCSLESALALYIIPPNWNSKRNTVMSTPNKRFMYYFLWMNLKSNTLYYLLMCGLCHLNGLSNFEIGVVFWNVYFLFWFLLDQKELYFYWNRPTFSISWRCPKIHFAATLKKTQQQKCFDIRHQFQHSMPCPNDMIHA